jgi:hypothetical protein
LLALTWFRERHQRDVAAVGLLAAAMGGVMPPSQRRSIAPKPPPKAAGRSSSHPLKVFIKSSSNQHVLLASMLSQSVTADEPNPTGRATSTHSRFASAPAWVARATLTALLGLVLYGLAAHAPLLAHGVTPAFDDPHLYRNIAERVARGQGYYQAAMAEHRAHGYPTSPAQVFREPALAWLMAVLRDDVWRRAAFLGLAAITAMALLHAFEREGMSFRHRAVAMVVMTTGIGLVIIRGGIMFIHEAWAGLLIALSLALYSPGRWRAAVVIGLAACLVRELALPYLAAMGALALWERRWRELAAWVAACAVFLVLFAIHLHVAAGLHQPGDATSPGWLGMGGTPYVLGLARLNLALIVAPTAVVALAVGLSLIGLVGSRNPIAARAALIVGGYMTAFLVLGRSDNNYWGALYAPILPLGVVLSPPALRDLTRKAFLQ